MSTNLDNVNKETENLEKKAVGRRKQKLQQWFRLLDPKWNFGHGSGLTILWLIIPLAIELAFLVYGGSSVARALTYSGTNLLMFSVIYGLKPTAPNSKKRPKDQKALIEYMKDLLLYERVLPTIPIRNSDYVKLCFERWWKVGSIFLLLGDAAILSVLTFYVKTLDVELLLLLCYILMTPIAYFFMEVPSLFPGQKGNIVYIVFSLILPYGMFATMFGRGVYQMITEKTSETLAVAFPLPLAGLFFSILVVLYVGGYALFKVLLQRKKSVSWNMDLKKKEA